MKRIIIVSFISAIFLSLFLQLYRAESVPACLNADEAAFAYNSYSLSQTGRDEFGHFLPLRLTSFGDYKLPLYSYLSIPFVSHFGAATMSIRYLNTVLAVLLVPAMFVLSYLLFKSMFASLVVSYLTATSLWIALLSRQAHESVLAAFLLIVGWILALLYKKKPTLWRLGGAWLFFFLSTFSYHTARPFFLLGTVYLTYLALSRKVAKRSPRVLFLGCIALLAAIAPFMVDIVGRTDRVANLLFFKDKGFIMNLMELLGEHPNRVLHNKITASILDVSGRYLSQFSPEFLVSGATQNMRFGFEHIGLITPVEVCLIFMGLYYLFKSRQKYRYHLMSILLLAPLGAALTWQHYSLNRIYFLIFPLILIESFGLVHFFRLWREKVDMNHIRSRSILSILSVLLILGHVGFLLESWDMYLHHYMERGVVKRSWQCGMKELVGYVKKNYSKFDRFVITDRYGQPYIFFLTYLEYDPKTYQSKALLSDPDEYGFSRVEKLDKLQFSFDFDPTRQSTVYVGFPDQFKDVQIDEGKIKKIRLGNDDLFWIYET